MRQIKNPTAKLAVGLAILVNNYNPTAAQRSSSALDSSRSRFKFTGINYQRTTETSMAFFGVLVEHSWTPPKQKGAEK
jgi:hypothetical protein